MSNNNEIHINYGMAAALIANFSVIGGLAGAAATHDLKGAFLGMAAAGAATFTVEAVAVACGCFSNSSTGRARMHATPS